MTSQSRITALEQFQQTMAEDLRLIEEKMRQRKILHERSAARIKKRTWEVRAFDAMLRRREAEAELARRAAQAMEGETKTGTLPEHDVCAILLGEQRKFSQMLRSDSTEPWERTWDDTERIQQQREERRAQNRRTDLQSIRNRALAACAAAEREAEIMGRPWGVEASAFTSGDDGVGGKSDSFLIDLEGPNWSDASKDVKELMAMYREKIIAQKQSARQQRPSSSIGSYRSSHEESLQILENDDDYDANGRRTYTRGSTSVQNRSRRPVSAFSQRPVVQQTLTATMRKNLGTALRQEASTSKKFHVEEGRAAASKDDGLGVGIGETSKSDDEADEDMAAILRKIADRPAWAAGCPRQLPRVKRVPPRPASVKTVIERAEQRRRPLSAPLFRPGSSAKGDVNALPHAQAAIIPETAHPQVHVDEKT